MRFGFLELLVILALALLFFGKKRLPELASATGEAIKNFKSGLAGGDSTEDSSTDEVGGDKID